MIPKIAIIRELITFSNLNCRTPCEHDDDYQEMARNSEAKHDVEGADGDGHSNCNCDDATSNTNIRL